ncbi:MAG: hypothetical protein Kow009_13630 [Spirochaetales bacterium]
MILGAGLLQIPAIRAAKQLGCRALVVDGNPDAPGRAEADQFEPVDLKDLGRLLEVARQWDESYGLDGVFTAGTDFSASVAYVAEALHLPGIPYERALDASHKARMRRRFSEHGVPSPTFIEVEEGESQLESHRFPSFPVVVKPVDNMGARGVVRVDSWTELKHRIPQAFRYSRSRRVVVEEFIEGPEFSLDALVYKGIIQICGIADRHIRFAPHFVEVGHTIPSSAPEEVQHEVVTTFKAGIQALGIDMGAAKGDIFYSPERGGVVGEIAARLSGGFMSGWTYPYSSGVNLTEGALLIALGEEPGDRTPKRSRTAAERAVISIPGRVQGIEGVEEAKRIPGLQDIFLRVGPGETVVFPTNNVEKCGNVIAVAEERDQAVQAAEKGVSTILITLEPAGEDTEDFLFTSSWMDGRSCYPIDSSIQEGLRSMPWDTTDVEVGRWKKDRLHGRNTSIHILSFPLPSLLEGLTGWNYLTIPRLMERLESMTDRWKDASWPSRWIPGGLFWYVVFRGGFQGIVWLFDHCSTLPTLETLRTKVNGWARNVGF